MPIPNITFPVNGTTPVVSNVPSVRFEWAKNGVDGVRRWWLFVGTRVGQNGDGFNPEGIHWGILSNDMGLQTDTVIPENKFVDGAGNRLSPGTTVYTQVMYEIVNDANVGPERGLTGVSSFKLP